MGKKLPAQQQIDRLKSIIGIGASLLLAFVLVVMIVQTITASPLAANLDGSSKTTYQTEAFPGQTVHYTVVISNSGDMPAQNVIMTDTLPVSLTYKTDSLTYTVNSASVFGFGESGGVITLTGVVSSQGSVNIYYQAILTDSLHAADEIANSVVITGAGNLVTKMATTTIITSAESFMPIVFQPVTPPVLNAIVRSSSSNQWTVNWQDAGPDVTGYELEQDSDPGFSSPDIFDVGTNLSLDFNPPLSSNNLYCYRVRAKVNSLSSLWSNVECVYGDYHDDFSSSASGWGIRRQDTDDTNNSSYYQNGKFVLKIGGRWDYAIAAPVVPAPWPSYRIETRVKLEGGIDNLHSYGLIFGGDWNGQPCPNGGYTSCFNDYYRLNVIWYGHASKLRVQLKRIDFHDSDNIGRGVTLFGPADVNINGDPSGWNVWVVEVQDDGGITIYVNNKMVAQVNDSTYIDNLYFGVFASADEYLGSEPWFDYYQVTALP